MGGAQNCPEFYSRMEQKMERWSVQQLARGSSGRLEVSAGSCWGRCYQHRKQARPWEKCNWNSSRNLWGLPFCAFHTIPFMLSIKYCCSIGIKRGEPPHLTLNLGTIFPMLSDAVSSNPADLVLTLYFEGHSHLLVSHIRPDLLFRISACFLWDQPPQLSLLPSKQWHAHF